MLNRKTKTTIGIDIAISCSAWESGGVCSPSPGQSQLDDSDNNSGRPDVLVIEPAPTEQPEEDAVIVQECLSSLP